jgi:hypothetical protein
LTDQEKLLVARLAGGEYGVRDICRPLKRTCRLDPYASFLRVYFAKKRDMDEFYRLMGEVLKAHPLPTWQDAPPPKPKPKPKPRAKPKPKPEGRPRIELQPRPEPVFERITSGFDPFGKSDRSVG